MKEKRYADAAKLAMCAGEEVAGDKRQLELLSKNVDLIAPLQSQQKVQELAFRRIIKGSWKGAQNVYSAALLSTVKDFKGEARGYLRSAENWLRSYFEESRKKENDFNNEKLKDMEIVELAFTHFNLFGPDGMVNFILGWQPPEVIFRVTKQIIRRFVDTGDFVAIDTISKLGCKNQYFMIGVANELIVVGQFPPAVALDKCLEVINHKKNCISKSRSAWDENAINLAIISFIETCSAAKLNSAKILQVLNNYFPQRASRSVSSEIQHLERNIFLRATALRGLLSDSIETDIETLMPVELLDIQNKYENERDITEFKNIVGAQLPWYILRSRIIISDIEKPDSVIQQAGISSINAHEDRWRKHDRVTFEINNVYFEILVFYKNISNQEIEKFDKILRENHNYLYLTDCLNAVRVACRLEHLRGIRNQLELSCREKVESLSNEQPETKAEWYIGLARAVLPISKADASAYFNCAIESVSKFGDEVLDRWKAVLALGKRYAKSGRASPELVYRLIRCADLVGENVDDHLDRNQVIKIGVSLCPSSVFAAVSRWRDRDIGRIDDQIQTLAYEAVFSKIITPSVGWSISAFIEGNKLLEIAALCIENESDVTRQEYILDSAVKTLRFCYSPENSWRKLGSLAKQFSLKNTELELILAFHNDQTNAKSDIGSNENTRTDYSENSENIDWNQILGDLELDTNTGLSKAITNFNQISKPQCSKRFWKEIFIKAPESNASKLLESIARTDAASFYDVQNALSSYPNEWYEKISVKRVFPNVLELIARRFASKLTIDYNLKYFLDGIKDDVCILKSINKGIITGLAESNNMIDAGTFFGFACIIQTFISPQEAGELLEFSLARFEKHIDDDCGDGPCAQWLLPPSEICKAVTGYVWAGLGSPRSIIRWQAVHCVRRLAETNCDNEIDALIEWLKKGCCDAFGSRIFPFYELHARQYLLIAMARIAIDNPEKLKRHYAVFKQLALDGIPHILIQQFAAKIALCIETFYPETYSIDITTKLCQIGKSQKPVKKIKEFGNELESPWHKQGKIDSSLKLHFDLDFDRYWFEPLGAVFGISAQQVEDLAREVVLKDLNIKLDNEFIRDPRSNLWHFQYHNYETLHSHGSYPKTDGYDFYLSYHAMLAVAAKLLSEMPIVHRNDWCDNEWSDWIKRHMLTRSDGRWLADRRDPPPLERYSCPLDNDAKNWLEKVIDEDFLGNLLFERDGKTWLNIQGIWNNIRSEQEESFYISSALVPQKTSQSLLNALSTCLNPRDYKLPDYQEEEMEFKNNQFELKGWIYSHTANEGLDKFDPYAGKISYPPYNIGQSIMEQLDLSVDTEQREWYQNNSKTASLICDLWGEYSWKNIEEPSIHGKCMRASLDFLKILCVNMDRDLIIKVYIERNLRKIYYSRSENEHKDRNQFCKTYLLSGKGILRDTRMRYQLR